MHSEASRSSQVLQFLSPLELPGGLTSLEEVRQYWKVMPQHTLLPADFFWSMCSTDVVDAAVLLEADWVQVGVWRGGGALFFRALMEDLGCSKKLYLFDTFTTIPVDGLDYDVDRRFVTDSCLESDPSSAPASVEVVSELFARFSLSERVVCCAGDVRGTDPADIPESIAFLHLDVDFYEATYRALCLFYPSVKSGGMIIIDDYYTEFLSCRQAVDDFIMEIEPDLARRLQRFSSYSALLIKP